MDDAHSDDVPSPIDFHDRAQARAWVDETVQKRPARPRFFTEFCAALAQLDRPLEILELGSGPGHLAAEILTRCDVKSYAALDFSEAMHQLAREHLGEIATRMTFVQRDFRVPQWAIGLGPFDAVVTMQAAHEMRHKRHLVPLLFQARSMLRAGGLLLYCDHYFEADSGKNSLLFLERQQQATAISVAGFSDVKMLRDEGGMALYAARG